MFTQEQVDSLIAAAVAKVTDEVKANFEEKVSDLEARLEVMETAKKAAETELETVKASAAQAEATALVDTAIKDRKLLPKHRDFAIAALSAKDTKIKFGKDEKSMPAMFKEFLETSAELIDTSERGSGKNKQIEFSNAAEEIDYLAKDMVNKDASGKLTYKAAMDKVMATNPELKARYAGMEA